MQEYKAFWISGSTVPDPPNTNYWTPSGAVPYQRDNGSVVELVRFTLTSFELYDEGVAKLSMPAIARLVVDMSYPELTHMQLGVG